MRGKALQSTLARCHSERAGVPACRDERKRGTSRIFPNYPSDSRRLYENILKKTPLLSMERQPLSGSLSPRRTALRHSQSLGMTPWGSPGRGVYLFVDSRSNREFVI